MRDNCEELLNCSDVVEKKERERESTGSLRGEREKIRTIVAEQRQHRIDRDSEKGDLARDHSARFYFEILILILKAR